MKPSTLCTALLGAAIQLSSHAALAQSAIPVPKFEAPARAVGNYIVIAINTKNGNAQSDACRPTGKDSEGQDLRPDERCYKNYWLVRSDNQLALLDVKTSGDLSAASGIIDGDFIHRKCESFIDRNEALQGGLFKGNFCRAYIDSASKSEQSEKFLFNNKVPELASLPIQTNGIEGFFLIFTGSQVTSSFTIELPRGEASPKMIGITEHVNGIAAGLPGHLSNTLTLIYTGI